jgi:hypothetical protein
MAFTSQVTMLFTRSVVTSDVGAGEVTAEFEQFVVHSAGGAGSASGGVCKSPPSARTTLNKEAVRMQIATNRLSSFIVFFVLLFGTMTGSNAPNYRPMLLSARIIALLAVMGAAWVA